MSQPTVDAATLGAGGLGPRRQSLITMKVLQDPDYYVDIKDLSIGPLLGRGAFSFVYVGKYFGDLVAIKKQVRNAETIEKYLLQELTVLKNLKDAEHENIISYVGACNQILTGENPYALYIITEYCQGGDLDTLLMDKSIELGWKFRVKCAWEAASAVYYLHDNNFIHRDIKSSNLLLDASWTVKLTDFGMSRTVSDPSVNSRMTICGTNEFMAPEMHFQEEYCSAVDIFSLGLVFFELLKRSRVGFEGFIERKPQTNFQIDVDATLVQLPDDAPPSLILLSQECIQYESASRPIALEVMEWLHELQQGFPVDKIPLPPMKQTPENYGDASAETPRQTPTKDNQAKLPIKTIADTLLPDDNDSVSSSSAIVGMPSTNGNRATLLRTRDISASVARDMTDVRRSGMLGKRNATGFRNWKKIKFTLGRTKLSWLASDGRTKHINLRGATVNKTQERAYRFQIVTIDENDDSTILNKEYAAESFELYEAWLRDINNAIATANDEAAFEDEKEALAKAASKSVGTTGSLRSFDTISDWLFCLGLSEYNSNFEKENYAYHMICDMGLKEKDIDYLQIFNPLHRAVLIACTIPAYSDTVRSVITGTRPFDSVTVYNVVSRYKFFRSSLCLRYTDFKKFDTVIRRMLKTKSTIAIVLPPLPTQGMSQGILGLGIGGSSSSNESRDPVQLLARQNALTVYLNTLASILQGTPHLKSLLDFLDLHNA